MRRKGYQFALGFSSLAAYGLERCERGARWVEVSCCVARRLERLPRLRRALALGSVSWSVAELLARVALPEDEVEWLSLARRRTVRELRLDVAKHRPELEVLTEEKESKCWLTFTLDREEAWLLEATRALMARLGVGVAEEQVEALLAEAHTALLAAGTDLESFEAADQAQQRWREQLERWRDEAEARCEARVRDWVQAREASMSVVALQAAQGCASLDGLQSRELDAEVRAISAALAGRELRLARLLLSFHRADGWLQMGFATEAQYARERLGMCRSSLMARRALALRLEGLSRVEDALGRAEIGVEAALQLVRIATRATEEAWLDRARHRTVKHLREEVAAALVAVRISGERDCLPPNAEELDGFQELERAVLRGHAVAGSCPTDARGPWRTMLSSLQAWFAGGIQVSAGSTRSAGRVLVRLRVSCALRDWWCALAACAHARLARGVSWVRFLCLTFWRAWGHMVGVNVAYGQVYLRDRCRCSSPVCSRRDVTPHHVVFRSLGGSDDDENVTSLCTWCHLFGVHGGRIRASGRAPKIVWELGCLRVEGRERSAA
ncbi:MAG TPA: HNH endonuclease signature motif containing protein [Polyangiaceae bacterium]|nr:HNH endonuclease signature motif containing protein [Polyangiaceae bacterium]